MLQLNTASLYQLMRDVYTLTNTRVDDLCAAFRITEPGLLRECQQKHTAGLLCRQAVCFSD